jgi:hypothetical protein
VTCSLGRVALSLGGIESQSTTLFTSRHIQGFCVHESWWVQDNPGSFRNHSAVLYFEFCSLEKRKMKERKKKYRQTAL